MGSRSAIVDACRDRRSARGRAGARAVSSARRVPDRARGALREHDAPGPGRRGLLVVGLQQRLLSSIEAFARSLKVHRATVERQWEKGRRRR